MCVCWIGNVAANILISGPIHVDKCGDIVLNIYSSSLLSLSNNIYIWDYVSGDLPFVLWQNWVNNNEIAVGNPYLHISNTLLTNAQTDASNNITNETIELTFSMTVITNGNDGNLTDTITIYKNFANIFATVEFDANKINNDESSDRNVLSFDLHNYKPIIDYHSTFWDATGVNSLANYPYIEIVPIVYPSQCLASESSLISYQWNQVMSCFVFFCFIICLRCLFFVVFAKERIK